MLLAAEVNLQLLGFPDGSASDRSATMGDAGDMVGPWVGNIPGRGNGDPHSNILALKNPTRTEEPGRLQLRESQKLNTAEHSTGDVVPLGQQSRGIHRAEWSHLPSSASHTTWQSFFSFVFS